MHTVRILCRVLLPLSLVLTQLPIEAQGGGPKDLLRWVSRGFRRSEKMTELPPPPPIQDPRLGVEGPIPASEKGDTDEIAAEILKSLERQKTERPNEIVQRDAHPKAHGCVKAEFKVPRLPQHYAKGIFAKAEKYKAWIRFSNGRPGDNPDSEGDARGMAIKVLGVPGAKLLDGDEKATQDFIVSNHPKFFVRNPKDYVLFVKSKAAFFTADVLFHGGHTTRILRETMAEPATNPFQLHYFSQTPYRFGAEGERRAVKYGVFPVPCGTDPVQPTAPSAHRDFLREAMISTMRREDVCFDFAVQFQTDADSMPIEDSTVPWSRDESGFVTLATLRIRQEDNDGKLGRGNEARTRFCENVAMTPWHSLAEHRPLGATNRVRKVVYQTISRFRRQANDVAPFEPTGRENF
jgi:hypothetical protein